MLHYLSSYPFVSVYGHRFFFIYIVVISTCRMIFVFLNSFNCSLIYVSFYFKSQNSILFIDSRSLCTLLFLFLFSFYLIGTSEHPVQILLDFFFGLLPLKWVH